MSLNRRQFLQTLAAAGLSLSAPLVRANSKASVIVIGGGFGGATTAKYLRKLNPSLKVTLIEPKKELITCPFSNWVIAGIRDISTITHTYDALASHWGVEIVHDRVVSVDADKHTVKLANGSNLQYDRLVCAPGISLDFDAIEGFSEDMVDQFPPAWTSAGEQTMNLKRQIDSIPDGGVFLISVPGYPMRCPTGPYERASLVADYFKRKKPRSKVIVLDTKSRIPEQAHIYRGWKEYYGYGDSAHHILFVPGPDGQIMQLDPKTKTVLAGEWEEKFTADVLNIIPPNKAGKLAFDIGLTDDSGWCPVNVITSESTLIPDIHVVGDSAIFDPVPKSAYSANTEAKNCAAAIVALLEGHEPCQDPGWMNTCYALINPLLAISIMRRYRLEDGKIVSVEGGGASPYDTNHALEVAYAASWYENLMYDTLK